ncbi:hypothetical protein GCM10027562_28880 [Arthrobacter pigmenti]
MAAATGQVAPDAGQPAAQAVVASFACFSQEDPALRDPGNILGSVTWFMYQSASS